MERLFHYTPPSYAIINSKDNLCIDKESYCIDTFFLFPLGYFKNEIGNICPVFPYVIETLVEVWENTKSHGNTRQLGIVLPVTTTFRSPKLPLVLL